MKYIVHVKCEKYETEIPCNTMEEAEMRMYKEAGKCNRNDWVYHVWIEEAEYE